MSVFLPCCTAHISCGRITYIVVEYMKWMFYNDLHKDRLYLLTVLCRSNEVGVLWCSVIENDRAVETWSLTLREESRLRVFESRALRRTFVAKRDRVTGEWRKLHSEELNDLYCPLNNCNL